MKKLWLICLVLALPLLTAASSVRFPPQKAVLVAKPEIQAAAPAETIEFGGLVIGAAYLPNHVFIKPGESVRWQGDFTSHPLVSDTGLWTTVSAGTQFEQVFPNAGTYNFHCLIHGAFGMTGTVTVGYRVFIADVIK